MDAVVSSVSFSYTFWIFIHNISVLCKFLYLIWRLSIKTSCFQWFQKLLWLQENYSSWMCRHLASVDVFLIQMFRTLVSLPCPFIMISCVLVCRMLRRLALFYC